MRSARAALAAMAVVVALWGTACGSQDNGGTIQPSGNSPATTATTTAPPSQP